MTVTSIIRTVRATTGPATVPAARRTTRWRATCAWSGGCAWPGGRAGAVAIWIHRIRCAGTGAGCACADATAAIWAAGWACGRRRLLAGGGRGSLSAGRSTGGSSRGCIWHSALLIGDTPTKQRRLASSFHEECQPNAALCVRSGPEIGDSRTSDVVSAWRATWLSTHSNALIAPRWGLVTWMTSKITGKCGEWWHPLPSFRSHCILQTETPQPH